MAININTGFKLLNEAESLDSRCLYSTVADMASATIGIYDGCIAYVKEGDEKGYYSFNKANDMDATFGLWRPLSLGGGGDVIDDTLEESSVKTYSINKIKELMNKNGGYVAVDELPDLTDEAQRETVALNKIYLVPNGTDEDKNAKDEYICVYTEGTPATYREALVTLDTDYDAWKTEIENYVTGGGSLDDNFDTYTTTVTTTTMTAETYAEMVESINASDADYNAYVARVTAIEVTPEIPESWAWECIGSIDGGSVTITEDFIPNNPIGKIASGVSLQGRDIVKVVMDMLSVDEATTISLSGSPSSTTLNEKGVANITDVALTATISLGTGKIEDGANVVFKKAGVAIDTQAYTTGTLTYTYTDTGANITDNTTYSVEVEYSMNDVLATAKKDITYKFALPMFYGSSSTSTIADVTALTKIVSSEKKQTITYTSDNGYLALCIPDTMSITSIKDSNNFENVDSWSYVTQSVTIGADAVIYKVYTTNTAVTCTNFKYVFTLA